MNINILDLNDDCIASILQCLPIDNHFNFAKVCSRFRYIWQDYRMLLYKRLELGNTTAEGFKQELLLLCQILPYVKHLIVNLNRHFDWSQIFMIKVLCAIKKMKNLEHVILWIKDNEPYGTLDPFLRSLQHLSNMKGLATYQDKEVVDILYQFSDCEEFRTESEMSRSPLIESIESHTKIRLLVFNNAPIHATLSDLVQHSTCIKDLSFRMTQSPEEYTPLAELPNLQKLQIFGNWQHQADYNTDLMPLVAAVSSKLSHQLHSLTINAPGLGYAETLEIIRIKGLQRLDCYFNDCQCLELLIHLTELTHLLIQLPSSKNIDRLFLSLVENCRNLKVLTIDSTSISRKVLQEAYIVLQKGKESRRYPSVVMLGDKAITQDQEARTCLTMHW